MGGGINPIEWVMPFWAVTHLAIDEATKAGAGEETSLAPAPNSPDDQMQEAEAEANAALAAEQDAQKKREEERAQFFKDFDEEKARGRARESAGRVAATLGGSARKRRATDYLTESSTALSGTSL
jgi:hypothetical protein